MLQHVRLNISYAHAEKMDIKINLWLFENSYFIIFEQPNKLLSLRELYFGSETTTLQGTVHKFSLLSGFQTSSYAEPGLYIWSGDKNAAIQW